MQNPNTVKLADVSPETCDKVHLFLRKQKLMHPDNHIRTLEDAILFAIEQTENPNCIQASGYLKEELDTFRKKDGKKETYEEIIWKLIWKVKEGIKGDEK